MNVIVATLSVDKPSKLLLSFLHDISSDMLQTMSIGFTSAIGSTVSTQYVLGWRFKMNGIATYYCFWNKLFMYQGRGSLKSYLRTRNLSMDLTSSITKSCNLQPRGFQKCKGH